MKDKELEIYKKIEYAFQLYEEAVWSHDDRSKKATVSNHVDIQLLDVLAKNVTITHQYWDETKKFLEIFRFHRKFIEEN